MFLRVWGPDSSTRSCRCRMERIFDTRSSSVIDATPISHECCFACRRSSRTDRRRASGTCERAPDRRGRLRGLDDRAIALRRANQGQAPSARAGRLAKRSDVSRAGSRVDGASLGGSFDLFVDATTTGAARVCAASRARRTAARVDRRAARSIRRARTPPVPLSRVGPNGV